MQLDATDHMSAPVTGRVLVVNSNSSEREAAISALQRAGLEAVGVDGARGVDGSFDLVVVAPAEHERLGELVRSVREMQVEAMREGADGSLAGPGGLRLLPRSREVTYQGRTVSLSPKEAEVLRVLLERMNEVLSPDDIASAVWGYPTFGSPNFVEAQISRLRSKLSVIGAAEMMQTIRGEGYVFFAARSQLLAS